MSAEQEAKAKQRVTCSYLDIFVLALAREFWTLEFYNFFTSDALGSSRVGAGDLGEGNGTWISDETFALIKAKRGTNLNDSEKYRKTSVCRTSRFQVCSCIEQQ